MPLNGSPDPPASPPPASPQPVPGIVRAFFLVSFALLSAALALMAGLSLSWKFQHDTALLFYMGFLVEHFGLVPYRDFFDVNLPASYLLFASIGGLTQYSPAAVRIIDLALLAALSSLTWRWMSRFGRESAWCSVLLVGFLYLRMGPAASLQREFLILLPITAGMVLADGPRQRSPWKPALTGLLFGVAFLIKPQSAIALPPILIFGFDRGTRSIARHFSKILPATLAGFLVPTCAAALWLTGEGALGELVSIIRNYYPLYAQLTGDQTSIHGTDRLHYLFTGLLNMGGKGWWLIPAAIGGWHALRGSDDSGKRSMHLLIGLAAAFSVYPLFAGKFWVYHWLPSGFGLMLLSSLCLTRLYPSSLSPRGLLPCGVVLVFAFATAVPTVHMVDQLRTGVEPAIKGGRVDSIERFLGSNLRAGDMVQPLDWTGGACHAMLRARARIATWFVYDVVFYHHTSSEYIASLRKRFLNELEVSRPRFIIEVYGEDKPWVTGKDSQREFPELSALLNMKYQIVSSGNGYFIHEILAGK